MAYKRPYNFMKQFLCILILTLTLSFQCIAQESVTFTVTENGAFYAPDGKDYVIIPYGDKSAKDIYVILASNINSMYNNPSKVMSGVEYTSIKIRARGDLVLTKNILGTESLLQAYYQLEFQIKDGRVKVAAPFVEKSLYLSTSPFHEFKQFSKVINGYFEDGHVKEKKRKDYDILNSTINSIVNHILGVNQNEEEW